MNQASSNHAIMLPSNLERQQIFYYLRKASSVTAWKRIFGFYKLWAIAIENSVRSADEKGWSSETSLPHSDYVLILKGLAHCEEAVARLGKGDKRIFKFDGNGELAMAGRQLSHWSTMLWRIETGDNSVNKHTPLWPQFCTAVQNLADAWGECGPYILEPRYLEEPAAVIYNDWMKNHLKAMPFPDKLNLVPEPVINKFVRTNKLTPCSGVWEPIYAPEINASLRSLFVRTPELQPPFKIAGALNYLHAGSRAPQVTVSTEDDSFQIDTTWRLLWRDDRYEDGTVPAEEEGYVFTEPKKVDAPRFVELATEELVWGRSGATASVGGKWLLESDLGASVTVNSGEKLPLYKGREVLWVLAIK